MWVLLTRSRFFRLCKEYTTEYWKLCSQRKECASESRIEFRKERARMTHQNVYKLREDSQGCWIPWEDRDCTEYAQRNIIIEDFVELCQEGIEQVEWVHNRRLCFEFWEDKCQGETLTELLNTLKSSARSALAKVAKKALISLRGAEGTEILEVREVEAQKVECRSCQEGTRKSFERRRRAETLKEF